MLRMYTARARTHTSHTHTHTHTHTHYITSVQKRQRITCNVMQLEATLHVPAGPPTFPGACVYVYVCVYVCVHIHINSVHIYTFYTHTHTHNTHTYYIYVYVSIFTCVYICIYMYVYVYTSPGALGHSLSLWHGCPWSFPPAQVLPSDVISCSSTTRMQTLKRLPSVPVKKKNPTKYG